MKILIVDDNDTNRKLLRALLEAEPHSVLDACDGKLALCVLNTESVDAVISDIMMPAMDGYTLCHEMPRTGKNGAAIFVITPAPAIRWLMRDFPLPWAPTLTWPSRPRFQPFKLLSR